jgi:hypothetical protein
VRDRLPINGASAYNIPDPQERDLVIVDYCAYCGEPLYSGDEVPRPWEGNLFCDVEHYFLWQCKHGDAHMVVLSSDGNHVVLKVVS